MGQLFGQRARDWRNLDLADFDDVANDVNVELREQEPRQCAGRDAHRRFARAGAFEDAAD